ncbi:C-C motif chemokine 3-like isoform X3 [Oreochromis aureus]|uniref:C-C motif chemokine 3-like isoform X3 n=1 Tax=Oreochromis aureus TaxID=47969 RepID=UPI001952E5FF|nr:C-C motif chemokine 3-like isoform X3 [Oreochromis aureus]
MKTLSLTVGLLLVLFTAYYDASKAVNSPDFCCFEFFDKRIPKANIVNITKTHSQCSTPAFVIETPRGEYCVRQTVKWAKTEFIKQETKKQLTHQAPAAALMNASSRNTSATP